MACHVYEFNYKKRSCATIRLGAVQSGMSYRVKQELGMSFSLVTAGFVFITMMTVVAQAQVTLFSHDEPLAQLHTANFSQFIHQSSKMWIVDFYASWCGHCQRMAPEYSIFARDIQGWSDVVGVAAVACSDPSSSALCRNYGITGYPSVKLFPPHSANSFLGDRFDGDKQAAGLKTAILAYLVQLVGQGKVDSSWPRLSHIRNPRELYVPGARDVYVVVEDESMQAEHIGLMVILDSFSLRPAVVVGRMKSDDALLHGAVGPGLFRSTAFGALHQLTSETSRQRITDVIRERSGQRNPDADRNLTTTLRPPSKQDSVYKPPRGLHMQDLESGLYYSLWVEIPAVQTFNRETLTALKKYISILAKYHPGEQHVKRFLARLNQWLASQMAPLSAESWLLKLKTIQSNDAYINERLRWTGCNGSEPHMRGYPCSLWMTFHALTVAAYNKESANASFNALDVLVPIREYVRHFLGCRDCANNFMRGAQHMEQQAKEPKDVVLWLWKSHNRANFHLHGDATEDPLHPKLQFPSYEACPQCRHGDSALPGARFNTSDSDWREDRVLTYLLRYYGEEFIIDDDVEGRLPDADKGSPDTSPTVYTPSCFPLNTEWTTCSRTCDVGISMRVTNQNPGCRPEPEIRMCLIRPCTTQFPTWSNSPWHVTNCPRLGHTYRLSKQLPMSYGNCSTVAREAWRVCGKCPRVGGRPICCRPSKSSTEWRDVNCLAREPSSGQVRTIGARLQVEIVDYCKCDHNCAG